MNKLLVKIYVPLVEEEYDIYIPINKKIGCIKTKIIDSISELSNVNLSDIQNLKLYDQETGGSFDNNIYVKDSSIRNGTKLLLL